MREKSSGDFFYFLFWTESSELASALQSSRLLPNHVFLCFVCWVCYFNESVCLYVSRDSPRSFLSWLLYVALLYVAFGGQDESDCFVVAQKGLDSMEGRIGRALREAAQPPLPHNGAGGTSQRKPHHGGGGGGGPNRGPVGELRGGESRMWEEDQEEESEDESLEEQDNDSDEDFEAPPSAKRGPGRPAASAPAKAPSARDYQEGSEYEDREEEEAGAPAARDPRARRASPRGGFSDGDGGGSSDGGGGGGGDGGGGAFYEDGEDNDDVPSKRQRR